MRRVVLDVLLSLDGYFADTKSQIDWFSFDEESLEWSREILRSAGSILMGRVTFDLMAQYWPTPAAMKEEPVISHQMTDLPKVVISKSLKHSDWKNTTFVNESPSTLVRKMKNESGGAIDVLGSSSVVAPLVRDGLIDVYKIRIQPVILGKGRPLFTDDTHRSVLRLVDTKAFRSGVVGLTYEPAH